MKSNPHLFYLSLTSPPTTWRSLFHLLKEKKAIKLWINELLEKISKTTLSKSENLALPPLLTTVWDLSSYSKKNLALLFPFILFSPFDIFSCLPPSISLRLPCQIHSTKGNFQWSCKLIHQKNKHCNDIFYKFKFDIPAPPSSFFFKSNQI